MVLISSIEFCKLLFYMIELEMKFFFFLLLNALKIILYFQVKYIYNMFCKFQPGLTVLALYGKMNQLKRMAVYDQFCRKQSAVLFATDVAARGLGMTLIGFLFFVFFWGGADFLSLYNRIIAQVNFFSLILIFLFFL